MRTYLYTKAKRSHLRTIFRFTGLGLSLIGLVFGFYTLSPLISWELYLKPAFANSNFASPIPQTKILTRETLASLLTASTHSLHQDDWMPTYKEVQIQTDVSSYELGIPSLNIPSATVSTVDTDLNSHLVQFPGTPLPPKKGNTVIFGHSTLPQLYNPKDYKTIFANALDLKLDDLLRVSINNALFTYRIMSITVVDAEDMSYLTQEHDDSYLTIVTCTPPGTTWKRLIIKARLERI
jgi:sortase A